MPDPLSIGGLGIGVVSLTAQVFLGCVQAIDLILKAKNLKPEFRYLNIRLQIEKQRLWNWSDFAGIVAYLEGKQDALDRSLTGLNRHLILEVISEVQILLTNFVKFKDRYQEIVLENAVQFNHELSEDPHEASSQGSRKELEDVATAGSDFMYWPPGSEDKIKKLLRKVRISETLPKRLRWALWDVDKFKELVDRFKELNDSLIDLVDNSIKLQILQTTKETSMSLLGVCNKVDDLSQLVLALGSEGQHTSTYMHSGQLSTSSPQSLRDEDSKELLYLTRFKALNQALDDGKLDAQLARNLNLQQPSEEMRSSELVWTDVELKDNNYHNLASSEGMRNEGIYRGRMVWIEWKDYQPANLNFTGPDHKLVIRAQKLATLLRKDDKPAAFRVPHCLGYFDDVKHNTEARKRMLRTRESRALNPQSDGDNDDADHFRLGFLFQKPSDVSPSTVPISLLELLKTRSKPSLTQRMLLSRALANCLRYLHSVNWLHKGIRSHNVLFFPNERSGVFYGQPYLSGFDYARPASQKELTEPLLMNTEYDIYRHPAVRFCSDSEGYRKSFDTYSLGIILIEIIEWRPIGQILGLDDPETVRSAAALRVRNQLLNHGAFLESVASNGGALFEASVRYCLESGDALETMEGKDETKEELNAKLGEYFYENVIKRLEGIKC